MEAPAADGRDRPLQSAILRPGRARPRCGSRQIGHAVAAASEHGRERAGDRLLVALDAARRPVGDVTVGAHEDGAGIIVPAQLLPCAVVIGKVGAGPDSGADDLDAQALRDIAGRAAPFLAVVAREQEECAWLEELVGAQAFVTAAQPRVRQPVPRSGGLAVIRTPWIR